MSKEKRVFTFKINAILVAFSVALLVNHNLEKNYRPGEYIKAEDAYFVEKITDPTGYVKAQKFVTPTDNQYSKQKTRSMGTNLIGDIESVWDSYTGEGTTIAIIDDGFDTAHPEYIRSDGTNAILSTSKYFYVSGSRVVSSNLIEQEWYSDEDYDEWDTHGTNTSTTAAAPMNNGGGVGVAPNADILALKIDFSFGAIEAAINYAIEQKVDVINMSLGAYAETFIDGFGEEQDWDSGIANYLNSVCLKAYNAGIIVVAAAGNEATYRKSYPACNTKVIGVGAIGDDTNKGNANVLAEFTNYVSPSQTGEINVDILAPGYVYTAHKTGSQSSPTHTYNDTQGTSFSSPIIAGAAALWKEKYPTGTPTQFLNELQASADGINSYTNKMVPVSEWGSKYTDVGPSNITNGRLNVANLLDITNPYVTTVQSSINISVGETRQINLASSNGTISYQSSDPSIATISNSGLVEGKAAGNATMTVTATKDDLMATATVPVTVSSPIAASSITFNPEAVTLKVGDTYNAEETLSVTPANASRIFLFESNNPSIATIDEDTGLVTAVGVGTTTIDAISIYGDGYDELTITVDNPVPKNGTISFGSAAGKLNVTSTNVSGTDNLSNPWTVTTTGTTSFTPNANYSQLGSSNNPASSIQFVMTLPSTGSFTSVTASFGGNNNSAATVTIKVGTTTIGTGSVVSGSDTTTTSNTTASGTTLSISLTNISRGIKAYSISYTYTSGGSTPAPTLTSVSATNTKTYQPGQTIVKSDITVSLTYSDGTVTPTTNFTFASDGYRFTYEDTFSGGANKAKEFAVTYNSQSYSFSVNVARPTYSAPTSATTTLGSSQFNASNLSKNSSTPSNTSVTIGGVPFTVTTNAYVFNDSSTSTYYLSFDKAAGSIQNSNMTSADLSAVTVSQKSNSRQDGVLTISKNGTSFVTYTSEEVAKGGYRYFKFAYTNTNTSYSNIASISFTLKGSETPTTVSNYIMYEDTNNQCLTKLDLVIEKLNTMSNDDKNTFLTSDDYVISVARERLLAWARHENRELVLSEGSFQTISVINGPLIANRESVGQSHVVLLCLSLMGVMTAGIFLYWKRKKSESKKSLN